jgi:catechol 2,3-dioxygenase-like lactoylglutathione lyase family enzyme
VRLAHPSLAVADQQPSRRLYGTFFGFDCDGEPDNEGCLHLTDADDFDLTLVARPNVSPSPSIHFGIRVADPDTVRRLLTRLSLENARRGITNPVGFEPSGALVYRHWNQWTGDQELRLEIDGD